MFPLFSHCLTQLRCIDVSIRVTDIDYDSLSVFINQLKRQRIVLICEFHLHTSIHGCVKAAKSPVLGHIVVYIYTDVWA